MASFVRDWVSSISSSHVCISIVAGSWMPPTCGYYKLNFDGSSRGNLGPSGFSCVIRDEQGEILSINGSYWYCRLHQSGGYGLIDGLLGAQ